MFSHGLAPQATNFVKKTNVALGDFRLRKMVVQYNLQLTDTLKGGQL